MPSDQRNRRELKFLAPKSRLARVLGLAAMSSVAIRVWCKATLNGFGGNEIFQVIVVSVLLVVVQISAIYYPMNDNRPAGR